MDMCLRKNQIKVIITKEIIMAMPPILGKGLE